jgi:uncharacterized Zn finger protein (UPF0148 family)
MNEAYWECSECGGRLHRDNPPAVCPDCGTAGALFVEAEHDEDEDPEQVWLHDGMDAGEFRTS